jgi:hypothetical protein
MQRPLRTQRLSFRRLAAELDRPVYAEAFPRNAVARLDGAGRGRVPLLNTCRAVRVPNRGWLYRRRM